VHLLLGGGIMYAVVGCAAIGTGSAESTIPLLFTGIMLVTTGYLDSTILALSEYATIYIRDLNLLLYMNVQSGP
jgi:hypothetical protein